VPEQATTAMRRPRLARGRRGRNLRLAEGALVWFVALILSGPPRVRTRNLTDALESPLTTLDPTAVIHIAAWAGTAGLIAYLLYRQPRRRRAWRRALTRNAATRWYLLFGLLAVASAAYSPSRLYTLFFAAKIFIALLGIVLVCESGPSPRYDRALLLLFAVSGIRAIMLIVLYFVDPSLVGTGDGLLQGYRLTGGDPGDYGESALLIGLWLLTVAIFGRTRMARTAATIGYAASWGLLLASQTRSTITAGVICFAILVSLRRSSRAKAILVVTGAVGLGLFLSQQAQVTVRLATRSGEGIRTLTGRTDAFDYLMEWWARSPIYGYGYGAGTRAALVEFVERTGLGIGAGHDVLSTVLVDLGLIGAAVLLCAFAAAWWQVFRLWRRSDGPRQRLVVAQLTCLAVWVTISAIVSSSLAGGSMPFFVLIGTGFAMDRALWARRQPGGVQGVHSTARFSVRSDSPGRS
jgi:O-antigen ligase